MKEETGKNGRLIPTLENIKLSGQAGFALRSITDQRSQKCLLAA